MNILIKDIDVITGDEHVKFVKKGYIGIADGRIIFVESSFDKLECIKAEKVIDGRHMLAMPGLVNAHTHCGMTILRNSADDLGLEDWLFNRIFPLESRLEEEDVYWGTLLGIAEMLKSGTTAFADMYLHMEAVARAVLESGIRANLSKSPLEFDRCGKRAVDNSKGCYEYFRKWNGKGNGRIKVYLEVHSAYLYDEERLKDAAGLARQCGTGIHIHILETARERKESIERYGMDPVEICHKCGIFDVPVIAAHCVHLSDENIRMLEEYGVNAVHNPSSNLKLGSGIARVPLMLDSGINVAIGTDGAASNNNLNMFEEMHLTALLHKGVNQDPQLMNAEQVVRMATANGAKAIGFGEDTGLIKKGMKADLILIDTDKLHLYPMNDPVSAAVYSVQGSDVDTVIIDGEIVMEKRELKTIDEERVKYNVKKVYEKLFSAAI